MQIDQLTNLLADCHNLRQLPNDVTSEKVQGFEAYQNQLQRCWFLLDHNPDSWKRSQQMHVALRRSGKHNGSWKSLFRSNCKGVGCRCTTEHQRCQRAACFRATCKICYHGRNTAQSTIIKLYTIKIRTYHTRRLSQYPHSGSAYRAYNISNRFKCNA